MIIGREREKQRLNKAYLSNESEFVVVYGRRRVGKTYLIREFFEEKKCFFVHTTGSYKEKLKVQLDRFIESLSKTFFDEAPLEVKSWKEAFKLLQQQILKTPNKKIVLFFDELPWLVTPRSGLLQLIEYYWNHHWSKLKNVILIACGSSASWLIKNIIYNKGGLHNRVTCELRLMPFNLYETREYLKYRKIKLINRQILLLYMALGGIPYYLKYIEPGLTADQNIQNILFNSDSPLHNEFKKLFLSLFEQADAYLEIIHLVSYNKSGVSRSEIESQAKFSTNGGRLSERLKDLCQAGFLEMKIAWNKKLGEYYKLIDEFTLFQLHWVLSSVFSEKKHYFTRDHWINISQSQSYKTWSGYAFENICMKHIEQIIASAKIPSANLIDSWRYVAKDPLENGAQIDLLIDRNDNAITLCEIKFTQEPFIIDKAYAKALQHKMELFQLKTKTKKQLFWLLISANGIKPSMYSEEMLSGVVTLDDLFKNIT